MKNLSDEKLYALDILRFLAMARDDQLELLAGAESPSWIADHHPLRGALEEIGENATFLLDRDSDEFAAGEQPLRELEALIELLLWADAHHPSGHVFTSMPTALDRVEWSLIRRLAGATLDGLGQQRIPFHGDWQMIFAN